MADLVPAAIFVSFLWGVAPVVQKHVLHTVDPKAVMVLTCLCYSACILVFTGLFWKDVRKEVVKVDFQTFMWIALIAILSTFVANFVYLYALRAHSSYAVTALAYSSPIFTLALAYMFLQESPKSAGVVGVLLVVAGIVVIGINES